MVGMVFHAAATADLGNLKVSFSPPSPGWLWLTDEKGNILHKWKAETAGSFSLSNIRPGKCRLKFHADTNSNGQWDTGNYLKGEQPEAILVFDKTMEIRANWDLEEKWDASGVKPDAKNR